MAPIDGGIWAGGPDYKCYFRPGAIEFHPALGSSVPQNCPITLQLVEVERGGEILCRCAPDIRPAMVDDAVVIEHEAGIREVFVPGADGIELQVHFDERPRGSGDLIVRYGITTELIADRASEDEGVLRFLAGTTSGVVVGPVSGVDADDRVQAGSSRCDDGYLEFILPSRFVDTAALPLVLDPLIGTGASFWLPWENADAAVGFDATTDSYLIAWRVSFSGLDHDVVGQRLNLSGQRIGGVVPIEFDYKRNSGAPRIATAGASGRFVVAYQVWDIGHQPSFGMHVRVVDADDGDVSGALSLEGTTGLPLGHDVGGVSGPNGDHAIVAWANGTPTARIHAHVIDVPLTGEPSVGGTFAVSDSKSTATWPSICKSDDGSGRFMVAWTSDDVVRARMIDRNGALGEIASVGVEPGVTRFYPKCAGTGSSFVVSYLRRGVTWSERPQRMDAVSLVCRRASFAGDVLSFSEDEHWLESGRAMRNDGLGCIGPEYVSLCRALEEDGRMHMDYVTLHPRTLSILEHGTMPPYPDWTYAGGDFTPHDDHGGVVVLNVWWRNHPISSFVGAIGYAPP